MALEIAANAPADTPAPVLTPEQEASAAHDAAMVAVADQAAADALKAAGGTPTPDPAAPVKPEGVPDKFWNATTGVVDVVALAKSYTELEKKGGKVETPTPDPVADAAAAKAAADAATAKTAGVDLDKLQEEYNTNGGKLSAESYADLAAKGFDKALVDNYISGREAIAGSYEATVHAEAGGREQYIAMVQWAAASLTKSEADAFDKAVTSKDVGSAKLAIAGLQARYTAANGSEPALLGGAQVAAAAEGYKSSAEVTKDMRDPRYHKDPAYRAAVERKLSVSPNHVMNVS